MRKIRLIVCFVAACLVFTACTYNTETVTDEYAVRRIDRPLGTVAIVKIGNHEYLQQHFDRSASICHYADCEYCNNRQN